ncbi:phage baseplate assembly protein V [Sapientia aquatica]|uniref:Phage baseplate assembly protein V n=1 Tax=Sapientia aquatica TaxID=1549640 RepID=A0A4R5W1B5_9BURK|nr:phage baseplate assembly protein V [Sapientia aquatica]TDK65971.1 phage baseplate assembly protein V [Sapientia aquatica]
MSSTQQEFGVTARNGLVSDIDPARHKVRVIFPELDNLESFWLSVLARKSLKDKDYWLPDVGEQVAVLMDAFGEDGWVLGAVFSDIDKPSVTSKDKRNVTFADGAVIEYDRQTHHFDLRLPAGATMSITADGGIKVTGNVTIEKGDITIANGSLKAPNGDVVANGVSVSKHSHGGVRSGSENTWAANKS